MPDEIAVRNYWEKHTRQNVADLEPALSIPQTADEKKLRCLAEAAMSILQHETDPEIDGEGRHAIRCLENRFRKIL